MRSGREVDRRAKGETPYSCCDTASAQHDRTSAAGPLGASGDGVASAPLGCGPRSVSWQAFGFLLQTYLRSRAARPPRSQWCALRRANFLACARAAWSAASNGSPVSRCSNAPPRQRYPAGGRPRGRVMAFREGVGCSRSSEPESIKSLKCIPRDVRDLMDAAAKPAWPSVKRGKPAREPRSHQGGQRAGGTGARQLCAAVPP